MRTLPRQRRLGLALGSTATTFRFESGSRYVPVDSAILASSQVASNDSGFLAWQITQEPDGFTSQLVFANSLDSVPMVVVDTEVGFGQSVFALAGRTTFHFHIRRRPTRILN